MRRRSWFKMKNRYLTKSSILENEVTLVAHEGKNVGQR